MYMVWVFSYIHALSTCIKRTFTSVCAASAVVTRPQVVAQGVPGQVQNVQIIQGPQGQLQVRGLLQGKLIRARELSEQEEGLLVHVGLIVVKTVW